MKVRELIDEEVLRRILQALKPAPVDWQVHSLFSANNVWLSVKTSGYFPGSSTVENSPNGVHFLFLRSKVWGNAANRFSPCSSQNRGNEASIQSDKPLVSAPGELPFRLHRETFIRNRIKINIRVNSPENESLDYKGVVGDEIINNHHFLYTKVRYNLHLVD